MARTDEWRTPPDFFEYCNKYFGPFELDAAATKQNALCGKHYTVTDDGLELPWISPTWCNPPYSDIAPWVQKAEAESTRDVRSLLLLPANTDTIWFHAAAPWATTYLLKGRLAFVDPIARRMSPRYANMLMLFPGVGAIMTLDWRSHMSHRVIAPVSARA